MLKYTPSKYFLLLCFLIFGGFFSGCAKKKYLNSLSFEKTLSSSNNPCKNFDLSQKIWNEKQTRMAFLCLLKRQQNPYPALASEWSNLPGSLLREMSSSLNQLRSENKLGSWFSQISSIPPQTAIFLKSKDLTKLLQEDSLDPSLDFLKHSWDFISKLSKEERGLFFLFIEKLLENQNNATSVVKSLSQEQSLEWLIQFSKLNFGPQNLESFLKLSESFQCGEANINFLEMLPLLPKLPSNISSKNILSNLSQALFVLEDSCNFFAQFGGKNRFIDLITHLYNSEKEVEDFLKHLSFSKADQAFLDSFKKSFKASPKQDELISLLNKLSQWPKLKIWHQSLEKNIKLLSSVDLSQFESIFALSNSQTWAINDFLSSLTPETWQSLLNVFKKLSPKAKEELSAFIASGGFQKNIKNLFDFVAIPTATPNKPAAFAFKAPPVKNNLAPTTASQGILRCWQELDGNETQLTRALNCLARNTKTKVFLRDEIAENKKFLVALQQSLRAQESYEFMLLLAGSDLSTKILKKTLLQKKSRLSASLLSWLSKGLSQMHRDEMSSVMSLVKYLETKNTTTNIYQKFNHLKDIDLSNNFDYTNFVYWLSKDAPQNFHDFLLSPNSQKSWELLQSFYQKRFDLRLWTPASPGNQWKFQSHNYNLLQLVDLLFWQIRIISIPLVKNTISFRWSVDQLLSAKTAQELKERFATLIENSHSLLNYLQRNNLKNTFPEVYHRSQNAILIINQLFRVIDHEDVFHFLELVYQLIPDRLQKKKARVPSFFAPLQLQNKGTVAHVDYLQNIGLFSSIAYAFNQHPALLKTLSTRQYSQLESQQIKSAFNNIFGQLQIELSKSNVQKFASFNFEQNTLPLGSCIAMVYSLLGSEKGVSYLYKHSPWFMSWMLNGLRDFSRQQITNFSLEEFSFVKDLSLQNWQELHELSLSLQANKPLLNLLDTYAKKK